MNREDIEKLLGGYATGTLTDEERQALFEAALDDQELFETLAREQALREVLDDPAARGELLAALDRPPRAARFWAWLRQPAVGALAATAAAVLIAAAVWAPWEQVKREPVEIARSVQVTAPPSAAAPTAPEPVVPKPAVHPVVRVKPKTAPEQEPKLAAQAPADFTVVPAAPVTAKKAEARADGPPAATPLAVAPPPILALRDTANAPPPPAAAGGVVGGLANARLRATMERQSAPQGLLTRGFGVRANANPGLRHLVLRKGADGQYATVPPGAPLHTGDAIRLSLEAGEPGYVYVLQGEGSGGWRALFDQRVEAGKAYQVPASGALSYDRPGRKEFYVLITRQPYQPLQALLAKEGSGSNILDAAALPAASMRIVLDVQ